MASTGEICASEETVSHSAVHLSGAALFLVIGDPFTEDHKQLILEQIIKGIQSWNVEDCGVDINEELRSIVSQAPPGEETSNGGRAIHVASDSLRTEILINPDKATLVEKFRLFLFAEAKHKTVIYAGHVVQGSGDWLLQDDRLAFSAFTGIFKQSDIESAVKRQEGASFSIHTFSEGDWNTNKMMKENFGKVFKVVVNPEDKLTDLSGAREFTNYLESFIKPYSAKELLQSSSVVGNIRFSRPTLYVFPGNHGDSSLFGISGFNLLVNGGYGRRTCFWDFTRHIDRIDALLVTHLGADNLLGLSSFMEKKKNEKAHPETGVVYYNAPDKSKPHVNGDVNGETDAQNQATLLVNIVDEGQKVVDYLHHLGMSPRPCLSHIVGHHNIEPINLYHKVGHGSLDMYVLNPLEDSKDVKDFTVQWNKHVTNFTVSKSAIKVGGREGPIPLTDLLSVCALLVWRPASSIESITRILFPGNCPQNKVFEGLDRLKNVNIFQQAVCSERDMKQGGKKSVPKPTAKSQPSKAPPPTKMDSQKKPPEKVVDSQKKPPEKKLSSSPTRKPDTKTPRDTKNNKKPSGKPASAKSSTTTASATTPSENKSLTPTDTKTTSSENSLQSITPVETPSEPVENILALSPVPPPAEPLLAFTAPDNPPVYNNSDPVIRDEPISENLIDAAEIKDEPATEDLIDTSASKDEPATDNLIDTFATKDEPVAENLIDSLAAKDEPAIEDLMNTDMPNLNVNQPDQLAPLIDGEVEGAESPEPLPDPSQFDEAGFPTDMHSPMAVKDILEPGPNQDSMNIDGQILDQPSATTSLGPLDVEKFDNNADTVMDDILPTGHCENPTVLVTGVVDTSEVEDDDNRLSLVESEVKDDDKSPALVESEVEDDDKRPALVESEVEDDDKRPTLVESEVEDVDKSPALVESEVEENDKSPALVESEVKDDDKSPALVESEHHTFEEKTIEPDYNAAPTELNLVCETEEITQTGLPSESPTSEPDGEVIDTAQEESTDLATIEPSFTPEDTNDVLPVSETNEKEGTAHEYDDEKDINTAETNVSHIMTKEELEEMGIYAEDTDEIEAMEIATRSEHAEHAQMNDNDIEKTVEDEMISSNNQESEVPHITATPLFEREYPDSNENACVPTQFSLIPEELCESVPSQSDHLQEMEDTVPESGTNELTDSLEDVPSEPTQHEKFQKSVYPDGPIDMGIVDEPAVNPFIGVDDSEEVQSSLKVSEKQESITSEETCSEKLGDETAKPPLVDPFLMDDAQPLVNHLSDEPQLHLDTDPGTKSQILSDESATPPLLDFLSNEQPLDSLNTQLKSQPFIEPENPLHDAALDEHLDPLSVDVERDSLERDTPANQFDPLSSWGEPMGLPSPPLPADNAVQANGTTDEVPKAEPKPTGAAAAAAEKASKGAASKTKVDPKKPAKSEVSKKPASGNMNGRTPRPPVSSSAKKDPKKPVGAKDPKKQPERDVKSADTKRPEAKKPSGRPSTAPPVKSSAPPAKRPASSAGNKSFSAPAKSVSQAPVVPFYVDLTYVPAHGDPYYSDVDFFRRVRARYYVISALEPPFSL